MTGGAGSLRNVAIVARRVWNGLGRAQHRTLVVSTSIMALVGLLTAFPVVVVGGLVDRVADGAGGGLWESLALLAAVVAGREGLQIWRRVLVERVCTQTSATARTGLIERLLAMEISHLNRARAGALNARIARGVEGAVRLLKLAFLDLFPTVFTAAWALAFALRGDAVVGALMMMVFPIGLAVVVRQIATQHGVRVQVEAEREQLDGTVVELLHGTETIKSLGAEATEVARVRGATERLRATEVAHHIAMARFDAVKFFNEGFFQLGVIALTLVLVGRGDATPGEILTHYALFLGVSAPLREIHRILDEAHESSVQAAGYFELMDRSATPRPHRALTEVSAARPHETALALERVGYSYPGSARAALHDVDLSVEPGAFVGVCGPAGGGKSTIAKVLVGLIVPDEGFASAFGRVLDDQSAAALSELVAFAPQVPFFREGSIAENLCLGQTRAVSRAELIGAAQTAAIHDEIVTKLGGYDGDVYESGRNLSGGQKQRLVLARLLLRNPRALVLDEATSALDTVNEGKVLRALRERGMSLALVTHRIPTLASADKIYVVAEGRVQEAGTYQALAAKGGLFSHLLHAETAMAGSPQWSHRADAV